MSASGITRAKVAWTTNAASALRIPVISTSACDSVWPRSLARTGFVDHVLPNGSHRLPRGQERRSGSLACASMRLATLTVSPIAVS